MQMSLMEGQLIKPETANGCLVDKRAKREANLLAGAQTRRGAGGQRLWRPYGCGRHAEVHVVCGYSCTGCKTPLHTGCTHAVCAYFHMRAHARRVFIAWISAAAEKAEEWFYLFDRIKTVPLLPSPLSPFSSFTASKKEITLPRSDDLFMKCK